MDEAVKDSELIAQSIASAVVAQQLTSLLPAETTADLRADIDEAAKRVADRKRTLLRGHIGKLPLVFAGRGRGRIPKTDAERERERLEYAARVEAAYRLVRGRVGRKPTKISIASELREGGEDKKKGSDTRLNTFNLKLARIGVNYDEIVNKVESELHKNS